MVAPPDPAEEMDSEDCRRLRRCVLPPCSGLARWLADGARLAGWVNPFLAPNILCSNAERLLNPPDGS